MKRYPVFIAFVSAALFGAATPASKSLLVDVGPFTLAGLLYLGAAIGVLPFALAKGSLQPPWKLDSKNRQRLLGAVASGGLLGPVLLLFGLSLASASSVSLWLNLELAATAIIGYVFFRDHLTRSGWLGVLTAFVASIVLSWESGNAGLWAGLLVLAACACWGLDNHLTAVIDGITPSQSTLWKGLVAGCVNFTIGIAIEGSPPPLLIFSAALIVGVFSYGASIVLYIRAAQLIGATRSQLVFASAPFFGVMLSWLLLSESIGLIKIGAMLGFMCSVVFLLVESHDHEHTHPEESHEHWHQHDDGHHNHVHPGLPASTRHCHPHEHSTIRHIHPHWPDLHHRHSHNEPDDTLGA